MSVATLCLSATVASLGVAFAQGQPRSIGGGFYQTQLPTVSAPLAKGRKIELSIDGKFPVPGTLDINVEDVEEVSVDVSSAFRADDAAQASEMVFTSGARLLPSDDGLRLKVRIDPSVWSLFEDEKPSLEMTVTVPLATSIEVDAPYLQVSAVGSLGGLTIDETLETVEVRGLRGVVQVDSRNSAVKVSDLIGGFDLRTSNARISLTDIQIADVPAHSGGDAISRARTEDGRIDIRRYNGPLHVRTTRADIRGKDVFLTGEDNWIENSGGLIDMSFAKLGKDSRLDIRNSYEDIRLTFSDDLSATFSLSAKDGKAIEFDKLQHRILRVRENRIEAECGAGEAQVTVRAKYGGSILISGKP